MKIETAVIPVAGKGTRFLPATKEIPKEMIPLVDRPMIDYAVEEAVLSGIKQVIFVTSTGKTSIENYFDRNLELEEFLARAGKTHELERIKDIGTKIEVVTVRQKEQLGLGHAINCARTLVGKQNFAVILGDDLVLSQTPVTAQLVAAANKHQAGSVIGVMNVKREETSRYGIVAGAEIPDDSKTLIMSDMVEKPKPADAPTTLATPGRYILSSGIWECLAEIPRGVGGEYQLTDAIKMLAKKERVLAHIFEGDRFDTGNVEGYLNATIEFALRNPKTAQYMKELLREKGKSL